MAQNGTVEAIFVSPAGSAPMERRSEVRAVDGGLEGDRYLEGRGYWSGVDECEVTMIEAEALDEVRARGIAIDDGQHRRNIVTRGVALRELAGLSVEVGDAILAFDRPRPPCRYIESLTESGMTRALGSRRGGICLRVVRAGLIRVGDPVRVVVPLSVNDSM